MSIITEDSLDFVTDQFVEELRKDIPVFKEIGQKYMNKEITRAEFKAFSGGMGVYAQRGANEFMIRLRVLSGVIDYSTLKFINDLVNQYSLEYIHLTTRQTIQLHNLQLDDMIEIMEKSLENNIITRGGGGNYPRNVSLSPLSGVEKEEAFDVTPYAILVNKYFVSQITTYHLPRKFKVAFSNNGQDSAYASIADLGFLAVMKDGKEYFQVYLGGSMGPNGALAVPFEDLIDPQDILYHVEALLHLFQEEGDYQNKGKARIRYIVQRMGEDAFLKCYQKHLNKVKLTLSLKFACNRNYQVDADDTAEDDRTEMINAISQKQHGLYSVIIHPQGGLLKAKDLEKIIKFLEGLDKAQIRLSMDESMVIRNLTQTQAKALLEFTKEIRMVTRLEQSISCIGASICQIGIQNSQELLSNIIDYFRNRGLDKDILPVISISGCTNSCARHQVSEIGFQGKKKRVGSEMVDAFSMQLGGKVSRTDTALAVEYGDLSVHSIPEFLYLLALKLQERNLELTQYMELYEEEIMELVNKYRI